MRVVFELDDEVHRRLKVLAAQLGQSLWQLVDQWATVSVARGRIQIQVTYTYTPTTNLPSTGASIRRLTLIGAAILVAGVIGVIIGMRRRSDRATPPRAEI